MIATVIGIAAVLIVLPPRLNGVRAGIRALIGLIAKGIKSQCDLARANAAEVRNLKRQGGELTMKRLVVSLALAALALTACGSGNSDAGSGSQPAGGSSSSSHSYWWNARSRCLVSAPACRVT